MVTKMKDGFTMPGEAGYETLTLDLAKKWGADAIRDSDGTSLSREILEAGYDIYSTICIIRGHNEYLTVLQIGNCKRTNGNIKRRQEAYPSKK